MPIELARKLLNHPDFYKEGYDFQTLCRIRDCLLLLRSINPVLCDDALLAETLRYIEEKQE